MKEGRLIIGETERAGLPISAPLQPSDDGGYIVVGTIRWARRGTYFTLQQFRDYHKEGNRVKAWEDIDVVELTAKPYEKLP